MFCLIAITLGTSVVIGALGFVFGYISNMFWMMFREEGMRDKTLLLLIVWIVIAQHAFGIRLLFLEPNNAFPTETGNLVMMIIIATTYYSFLLIGAGKYRRLVNE